MSDHDHKDQPLLSRRNAVKQSLRAVLGVGVAAIAIAALPATPAKAGAGACSISGCPCQAYTGGGNNCMNCGHQYTDHW